MSSGLCQLSCSLLRLSAARSCRRTVLLNRSWSERGNRSVHVSCEPTRSERATVWQRHNVHALAASRQGDGHCNLNTSSALLTRVNRRKMSSSPDHPSSRKHRAMIALGSNLGDRFSLIEQACRKMESNGLQVMQTSFLYETAPMYVIDQGAFYNGVCEVSRSYPLFPSSKLGGLKQQFR